MKQKDRVCSLENPSQQEIETALAKIGWSLRHHGCEHWYFYNHKKVCTGLSLVLPKTDARLEFEGKNHRYPSFYFYLKDCVMNELEGAVSFRGKKDTSIFMLLPNYDQKKKPLDTEELP